MKTQPISLIVVLLSMLVLAGCVAPTSQPTPTQAPPTQPLATSVPPTQTPERVETLQSEPNVEVVQKMVERLNAGDVDASVEYFADDAKVYMMGFPPTGIEIYKGKDHIRYVWQDSVNNHFKWEVVVDSSNGDIVYVHSKTWHDFTMQLGVAPLEYVDVYQVIDGKIKTYGSWMTAESLSRFKPAFAAAVLPVPTATPFSGTPGSELTVTTSRGTCTTDSPAALKAGDVKLNWKVQDQDKSKYALTLFTLDSEKDLLDLMVATYESSPPTWSNMVFYTELGPGGSETYSINLEKGPLYVVCWSQPPDLPIGNAGPILVVPTE